MTTCPYCGEQPQADDIDLHAAGRCPRPRRQPTQDAPTARRGYGGAHQRFRRMWAMTVATGRVRCWRCGYLIAPGSEWHLGHDDEDRRVYRGPEHAFCNTSSAGKRNRLGLG